MASHHSRRVSLTVIVAVAVVIGVLLPWLIVSAQETQEPQLPVADPVTDTVEFGADLQAADKPIEVVEQYAWTSVNGQTLHSESSTNPQPMETGSYGTAGDVCVSVGAVADCGGVASLASATTTNGSMDPIAQENRLLLSLVAVGAAVTESMTTGVRCTIGEDGVPVGEAKRPTGEISYGGTALLGATPEEEINFANITSSQFEDQVQTGVLGGLVAPLYTGVEINLDSGWDDQTLQAYSEVTVTYAIGGSLLSIIDGTPSQERTFTARSECGMLMSDGSGSNAPAGVGAMGQVQALRMAHPEAQQTPQATNSNSAPGSPQDSGFATEDTLHTESLDYHLLATRELDTLDRLVIEDVLEEIADTGGVEGESWKVFSAEAAGEQVPVIEIEMADGAIVQARPMVPGMVPPEPDLTVPTTTVPEETSSPPETPSTPATARTAPETTQSRSTETTATSETAEPSDTAAQASEDEEASDE